MLKFAVFYIVEKFENRPLAGFSSLEFPTLSARVDRDSLEDDIVAGIAFSLP